MRLIDADAFKQWVEEYVRENNIVPEKGDSLCEAVDKQPTAYDVDKVVEGLEEEIELVVTQYPLGGKYIKKSRAIEIAKSGMEE